MRSRAFQPRAVGAGCYQPAALRFAKAKTGGVGQFGKPIYKWERKGVKWQLCWLPFGGFVRIAGMEKKGGLEPYQIPDGFYGKRPLSRIKVALMGPAVNIFFACCL